METDAQPSRDFNKVTDRDIQMRISPYRLNEKETGQVWKTVQDRDKAIEMEKKDYKKNFEERLNQEYTRLRAERKASPQHNLGRSYNYDTTLLHQAHQNVRVDHKGRIKDYYRNTEKQIDTLLDKARENGRGPQSEMNRDFQRAHDHDQNRDRR